MTGIRRIAITAGSGFVPGLELVAAAVTRAATRQGWQVVALGDGFDPLLDPGTRAGAPVPLEPGPVPPAGILSTGARIDPFHVRQLDAEGMVSESDRSDALLAALAAQGIDAVVAVVGGSAVTGLHALSVVWKLARKGLPVVAIPKSVEADIAGVAWPFGHDSALAETTRLLSGIGRAARDAGRLAVVEVPGAEAGWLALQAGLAAGADAILIPELPADLSRLDSGAALVVVAGGARLTGLPAATDDPMRASLSPLSDPARPAGAQVFDRAGATARALAGALQRQTPREVVPVSLAALVRGGEVSAQDRQLAAIYGVAAVEALVAGEVAALLSLDPPAVCALPMPSALTGPRTVPPDGALVRTARGLGIRLGD